MFKCSAFALVFSVLLVFSVNAEVSPVRCSNATNAFVTSALADGFRGFLASPFNGQCVPVSVMYENSSDMSRISSQGINLSENILNIVSLVFARTDSVVELFKVGGTYFPVMNVNSDANDPLKAHFVKLVGYEDDYLLWLFYHELAHLRMRIITPFDLSYSENEALADAFAVYMVSNDRGYSIAHAQSFHWELIKLRRGQRVQFSRYYDRVAHSKLLKAGGGVALVPPEKLSSSMGFANTVNELESYLYSALTYGRSI